VQQTNREFKHFGRLKVTECLAIGCVVKTEGVVREIYLPKKIK
jgi:hypothetical protein